MSHIKPGLHLSGPIICPLLLSSVVTRLPATHSFMLSNLLACASTASRTPARHTSARIFIYASPWTSVPRQSRSRADNWLYHAQQQGLFEVLRGPRGQPVQIPEYRILSEAGWIQPPPRQANQAYRDDNQRQCLRQHSSSL